MFFLCILYKCFLIKGHHFRRKILRPDNDTHSYWTKRNAAVNYEITLFGGAMHAGDIVILLCTYKYYLRKTGYRGCFVGYFFVGGVRLEQELVTTI